jgi:hypothetical protein
MGFEYNKGHSYEAEAMQVDEYALQAGVGGISEACASEVASSAAKNDKQAREGGDITTSTATSNNGGSNHQPEGDVAVSSNGSKCATNSFAPTRTSVDQDHTTSGENNEHEAAKRSSMSGETNPDTMHEDTMMEVGPTGDAITNADSRVNEVDIQQGGNERHKADVNGESSQVDDTEGAAGHRSKRRRASSSNNSYSPGEEGGALLKRSKVDGVSSSSGNSSDGNASSAHKGDAKASSKSSTDVEMNDRSNKSGLFKSASSSSLKNKAMGSNTSGRESGKVQASDSETSEQQSGKWAGPTYRWADEAATNSTGFLPNGAIPVDPIVALSPSCSVVEHYALEIDFGAISVARKISPSSCNGEENNGDWSCGKCNNINLVSKLRCAKCSSWKGGRRESFTRKPFSGSSPDEWTPPPPVIVRTGDVVLVSSGDTPWDDLNHMVNRAQTLTDSGEGNGKKSKSAVLTAFGVSMYDDPASREPGLGALDPYVAVIERMWEEVEEDAPKKKKSKDSSTKTTSDRVSRMMVRTRWFFRKEDLEELDCSFVIEGQNSKDVKQKISAAMSARDLLLSNQSDDNSVSAILGKTHVIRGKQMSKSGEWEDTEVPKGSFVCRYNIEIDPESEESVTLTPCNKGKVSSITAARRRDSDVCSGASSEDDSNSAAANLQIGIASYGGPMSPRRVISEGATTVGKIKVGPNHQAVVPPQVSVCDATVVEKNYCIIC